MINQFSFRIRFLIALLLPSVTIFLVLLYPGLPERKLDNSILFLIVVIILILLLPWEQITSLRAAGVGIALEARVDRAVEVVKSQNKMIADEKLRSLLKRLEPQIEQAAGSRILWIDNSPYNVLGERRLLRALDIEIVMAESSETAREYLSRDGDFDLLISDVRGKVQDPPEAIQFVQEVREDEEKRRQEGNYTHISLLPVIFYSSQDWKAFYGPIQELRSSESCVVWTSGVEQLVEEVLRILYHVRSTPSQFVQNPDRNAVS